MTSDKQATIAVVALCRKHANHNVQQANRKKTHELKKTKHTLSTHFCTNFAAVKNMNLEQQHINQ
uniref:hypothetical protein n=1 Tax=Prevotella sp. TaxID=59823 RepID=UPI003FF09D1A